jgi:hypothetical protein
VYELEDLIRKVIDGQFYNEELTPVQIAKSTTFKIDKIYIQGSDAAFASTLCAGKATVPALVVG